MEIFQLLGIPVENRFEAEMIECKLISKYHWQTLQAYEEYLQSFEQLASNYMITADLKYGNNHSQLELRLKRLEYGFIQSNAFKSTGQDILSQDVFIFMYNVIGSHCLQLHCTSMEKQWAVSSLKNYSMEYAE